MDETKSELKKKEYFKKNVDKSDLNHFSIDIQKRSVQEVETEHFMQIVLEIVWDHIAEKHYQNPKCRYSESFNYPRNITNTNNL